MGIISFSWLARRRKIAFILAFVLEAINTPTFNPINQALVTAPLIILFELSIWLAKRVKRKRANTLQLLTRPLSKITSGNTNPRFSDLKFS